MNREHRCAPSTIRNPQSAIRSRSGISLLEVLISIFVLLFGLMGVAMIFPVGNHYAGRGEQYDRGAALADQAFAELKARGMLDPRNWMYADPPPDNQVSALVQGPDGRPASPQMASARVIQSSGQFNVTPLSTIGPGHAFVLDPLGTAEAWRQAGSPRPITRPLNTNIDVFPFALYSADVPMGTDVETKGQGTNAANPWILPNPPAYLLPLSGERWPIRRLTVPSDDPQRPSMTPRVAETITRLRDDLANDEPTRDDRPGNLRWQSQVVGAVDNPEKFNPSDAATVGYANDVPLSRQYAGSYSWIATIVPAAAAPPLSGGPMTGANALQPAHPQFHNQLFDVSVAVFHKRVARPSADSERSINAALNVGGELVLYADSNADGIAAVDNAVRDLRPGNWIALAGVHPTGGTGHPSHGLFLLKWYKLLSLDDETAEERINPADMTKPIYAVRRAMLEGPDWPPPATGQTVMGLRAIILPGVIGVSTQTLRMEPAS